MLMSFQRILWSHIFMGKHKVLFCVVLCFRLLLSQFHTLAGTMILSDEGALIPQNFPNRIYFSWSVCQDQYSLNSLEDKLSSNHLRLIISPVDSGLWRVRFTTITSLIISGNWQLMPSPTSVKRCPLSGRLRVHLTWHKGRAGNSSSWGRQLT